MRTNLKPQFPNPFESRENFKHHGFFASDFVGFPRPCQAVCCGLPPSWPSWHGTGAKPRCAAWTWRGQGWHSTGRRRCKMQIRKFEKIGKVWVLICFWNILREYSLFGWRLDFCPVFQKQGTCSAHSNSCQVCFLRKNLYYSATTLPVLRVIVKVWCLFEVFSSWSDFLLTVIAIAQKLLHLLFLMEVLHETVARRPLAQPSRHLVPVGSLSLFRCAAVPTLRPRLQPSRDFGEYGRVGLLSCVAVQISRSLAQHSRHFGSLRSLSSWLGANVEISRATVFSAFWVSDRCSRGPVLALIIQEMLCGGGVLQRSCQESLYRERLRKFHKEILQTHISQRLARRGDL